MESEKYIIREKMKEYGRKRWRLKGKVKNE